MGFYRWTVNTEKVRVPRARLIETNWRTGVFRRNRSFFARAGPASLLLSWTRVSTGAQTARVQQVHNAKHRNDYNAFERRLAVLSGS